MTVATRKRQAQGLKVFADNEKISRSAAIGWIDEVIILL